jgi:uncharacterized protein (DUF1778 family)
MLPVKFWAKVSAMNDKRTSGMIQRVPQEDMVGLVQAARTSRVSMDDFVLQACLRSRQARAGKIARPAILCT